MVRFTLVGNPMPLIEEWNKLINTNWIVPSLPGIGMKLFATVPTLAKLYVLQNKVARMCTLSLGKYGNNNSKQKKVLK